jgi:hypothetical protein
VDFRVFRGDSFSNVWKREGLRTYEDKMMRRYLSTAEINHTLAFRLALLSAKYAL